MTPLAAHADQAVRHAVDAYIDGRFLPTFEGEAAFETRNSRYRLLDGVLLSAPDASLVGAELVGFLIEYPSRSEVSPMWKNGSRAVLVDTRNDGVRGPHIIVTSATRAFRAGRSGSAPRLSAPQGSSHAGSSWTQGGSAVDQGWDHAPAKVAPPAPVSPSWGYYPPAPAAVAATPKTLPPPPLMPTMTPPAAATASVSRTLPPPPMMVRPGTPPPPPPRPLPRPVPPPMYAGSALAHRIDAAIEACGTAVDADDAMPTARDERRRGSSRFAEGATSGTRAAVRPHVPENAPFMLTGARARAHQRGVPLR